jgi:hypothetical protein
MISDDDNQQIKNCILNLNNIFGKGWKHEWGNDEGFDFKNASNAVQMNVGSIGEYSQLLSLNQIKELEKLATCVPPCLNSDGLIRLIDIARYYHNKKIEKKSSEFAKNTSIFALVISLFSFLHGFIGFKEKVYEVVYVDSKTKKVISKPVSPAVSKPKTLEKK